MRLEFQTRLTFIALKSNHLLSSNLWKPRNTLFISKKVMRINLSLDLNQPIKVGFKVFDTKNPPFIVTPLPIMVNTNIKISIVQERSSWVLSHKWCHELVEFPCQVYEMVGLLGALFIPIGCVLDLP